MTRLSVPIVDLGDPDEVVRPNPTACPYLVTADRFHLVQIDVVDTIDRRDHVTPATYIRLTTAGPPLVSNDEPVAGREEQVLEFNVSTATLLADELRRYIRAARKAR